MQYILDENEYYRLRSENADRAAAQRKVLQDLCTKVADHMPVRVAWINDGNTEQPWGCILTKRYHYCDHCPVEKVCPNENKEFSQ